MKKKHKKVLITATQLALTGGVMVGLFVKIKSDMTPETAYMLTQEIPSGTKIVESDLKEVEIPSSAIQKGMKLNPKDVVGKYSSTKLYPLSYATKDMFIEKDEIDPFESQDMNGLRKISIPVEYTDALGGNLKYGDRVDLAYVGVGTKKDSNDEYVYSKTFIQNVLIYSVTTDDGYKYIDRSQRTEGEITDDALSSGNESSGTIQTITLAVTPDQAEEIVARKQSGEIQVIGRFVDGEDQDTPGYVIGEYDKKFSGNASAETGK